MWRAEGIGEQKVLGSRRSRVMEGIGGHGGYRGVESMRLWRV